MTEHLKFNFKAIARSLACLFAATIFSGVASASTIVSACDPLSGALDIIAGSLACPTFNSALGTLTSIEIDFTGSTSGTITLTNNALNPQTVTVNESTDFNMGALSGFSPTGLLFTTMLTTGPTLLAPGATVVVPVSSGTGAASSTDSNVGTFFAYTADGIIKYNVPISTATGFSGIGVGGNTAVNLATNGLLNANVTYTYDAAVGGVPEPTTLGLIGGGLVGIGLISRRKRATKVS